jgi:hypothetical protein
MIIVNLSIKKGIADYTACLLLESAFDFTQALSLSNESLGVEDRSQRLSVGVGRWSDVA